MLRPIKREREPELAVCWVFRVGVWMCECTSMLRVFSDLRCFGLQHCYPHKISDRDNCKITTKWGFKPLRIRHEQTEKEGEWQSSILFMKKTHLFLSHVNRGANVPSLISSPYLFLCEVCVRVRSVIISWVECIAVDLVRLRLQFMHHRGTQPRKMVYWYEFVIIAKIEYRREKKPRSNEGKGLVAYLFKE